MKYKIDLKPYPGASYFTVEGHGKAYDKLAEKPEIKLELIKGLLLKLFSVPQNFEIGFFTLADKALLEQDHFALDISYSFPQPTNEFAFFDVVMLDPNASMGVPTGFFILFYKATQILPIRAVPPEDRQVYILQKVLEDYHLKGLEMLVRECNYKAAVLYHMVQNSPLFQILAKSTKTNIAARCSFQTATKLRAMGYEFGEKVNTDDVFIVFANYPTQSKEMIEMLSDRVATL